MIGETEIPDMVCWNTGFGGAFYFYPVDRARLVEDCENDAFADWIGRTYGARLVVEEAAVPRALFDALRGGYDASLPENVAIANADHFSWPVTPEFEYYGENFYTIEGFRRAVESFRGESGQDVFCNLLASLLEDVAARAQELDEESGSRGFGVMVTGP